MTITTPQLINYILATLLAIGMVMTLTGMYWRSVIKKGKAVALEQLDQLKKDHEDDIDSRLEQQMQTVHIDRMKDRVTLDKQARMLRSKLDFYYKVLTEIQKLHDGMTSYMELFKKADLRPGQQEWDMLCSHMDDRADYIREMVDSTLKIMHYEELSEVERKDHVLVNNFCHDVYESCQQYLTGEVDVRLETELEDDETVTTNMKLLQIVLTALLRCSMQFTHEGEIVLKANRLQKEDKNYLHFAVSDTGQGIPERSKSTAFEHMADTDISIKIIVVRLRLCKAIVKLLGGNIFMDPHRKKGTSMIFTIQT